MLYSYLNINVILTNINMLIFNLILIFCYHCIVFSELMRVSLYYGKVSVDSYLSLGVILKISIFIGKSCEKNFYFKRK